MSTGGQGRPSEASDSNVVLPAPGNTKGTDYSKPLSELAVLWVERHGCFVTVKLV